MATVCTPILMLENLEGLQPSRGKFDIAETHLQRSLSAKEDAVAADKPAAEAAFRAAADKRAALEARLNDEHRVRYLALRQKQEAELKRQEHRLTQRRQDYETEVRKQGIAPTLDMIPLDTSTPRALRDAAREYASQDQWVADLKKVQERECDKFLKRAIDGEPDPMKLDGPRRSPSRE